MLLSWWQYDIYMYIYICVCVCVCVVLKQFTHGTLQTRVALMLESFYIFVENESLYIHLGKKKSNRWIPTTCETKDFQVGSCERNRLAVVLEESPGNKQNTLASPSEKTRYEIAIHAETGVWLFGLLYVFSGNVIISVPYNHWTTNWNIPDLVNMMAACSSISAYRLMRPRSLSEQRRCMQYMRTIVVFNGACCQRLHEDHSHVQWVYCHGIHRGP